MEIRRSIAAVVAAAPFCLCANFAGAQTITFGDSLQGGPVAAGYAGFQWGTGANQAINKSSIRVKQRSIRSTTIPSSYQAIEVRPW
jgi:hypothetical protein